EQALDVVGRDVTLALELLDRRVVVVLGHFFASPSVDVSDPSACFVPPFADPFACCLRRSAACCASRLARLALLGCTRLARSWRSSSALRASSSCSRSYSASVTTLPCMLTALPFLARRSSRAIAAGDPGVGFSRMM